MMLAFPKRAFHSRNIEGKSRMRIPQLFVSCLVLGAGLICSTMGSAEAQSREASVVETARAGKVDGKPGGSDRFIWETFTQVVKPTSVADKVEFQTWATDQDVYQQVPSWPPLTAPHRLRGSKQASLNGLGSADSDPCSPAGNPWVANFPLDGCLAEVVYRNRPQYDYIVNNGLYSAAGVSAFFASTKTVQMPKTSLSVKANWVPLTDILKWVPQFQNIANVRKAYYTITVSGVEYGLVAFHIASKWNPDWVWGTFEHQNNPGRCDEIGCYDSFGARKQVVLPRRNATNTQYGACTKTPALTAMMRAAGLPAIWDNYCLKSSQTTFVNARGTPTVLSNSVTERVSGNVQVVASCIACHAYASFGSSGTTTAAAQAMLNYNPFGNPLASVFTDAKKYDFMWGIININPVTTAPLGN